MQIEYILGRASHLLGTIHDNGADALNADSLRVLRKAVRDAVNELTVKPDKTEEVRCGLTILVLNSGTLWDETNDAAQTRLEDVLLSFKRKDFARAGGRFYKEAEHLLQRRNVKVAQPLFYTKPNEDEASCRLRGLDVIDKLANCPGKDQQMFAKALRGRLNDERPVVARPVEEDTDCYFGSAPDEVEGWLEEGHPFDRVEKTKRAEFFLRLLSERQSDQFFKREVLRTLGLSATDFSSNDALLLAQALDSYWNDVERCSPLVKDARKVNEKTPFLKGRGNNEYLGFIASAISHLRLCHDSVDAWLQQQYPEKAPPADAFPVKRLWFSRHWKPVAAIGIVQGASAIVHPFIKTDGHSLFLYSWIRGVGSPITGLWTLTPPQLELKKVNPGPENSELHHMTGNAFASDGWYFYCSMPNKDLPRIPNCPILFAASAEKPGASCNCDFRTNCRVIGWVSPYAYVLAGGISVTIQVRDLIPEESA